MPKGAVVLPQGGYLQGFRDGWACRPRRYDTPEYLEGRAEGLSERAVADERLRRAEGVPRDGLGRPAVGHRRTRAGPPPT